MAGERSDRTDPLATADQPPTEGEPAYEPQVEPGGDVPGAVLGSDHEEPVDGPETEPGR